MKIKSNGDDFMSSIESYEAYINQVAKIKDWHYIDLGEYLNEELKNNPDFSQDVMPVREALLTADDLNGMFNYLESNVFHGDKQLMLTLSSILQDILKISKVHFEILSFEPYHAGQPVFEKYPELLNGLREKSNGNRDYELIRIDTIGFNPPLCTPKFRTCEYKNHYLFIDKNLDSRIPRYLIDKYGTDHLYIRIDPYSLSETEPQVAIEEEFLRPPNPKWIERLNIYPGKSEGCEVFLPELGGTSIGIDEHSQMQYFEYQKGIRKLETNASMKNENGKKHFSMSLEELSVESLSEGKLIGRMIHLDAIDAYDMPFDKIRLNHLDLAINVYKDEAIEERNNCSLASGGVITDASYRTHLFRADSIMLSDLLEIARLFFKSTTMVEEWIEKQFEFMKV